MTERKLPVRHFVREWRKYRGLTQVQLAERAGRTHGAISQLENGIVDFTQSTLEALAAVLQCEPGQLLSENPLPVGAMRRKAHRFSVRVYYEDTDFSGIVYHAAYLHFFERARTEFLRAIGVLHSELIGEGIALAVRSMQIDFDAAAHIDDMLEVETRVESVTPARLHLDQRITRDGAVITRARVLVVAIKTSGKPARMPAALLAALGH